MDELVCECPLLVGFGSTAAGSMSSEGHSVEGPSLQSILSEIIFAFI